MWRQHLILCLTIATCAAIPKADRTQELQRLVRLPQIDFAVPLEFDRGSGFTVFPLASSAAAEVRRLLAEAKGTAEDAPLHLQAARLYAAGRDVANAIRSYARAADLFGQQVSRDPAKGSALIGLADALGGLGRLTEAEAVLRKAEGSTSSATSLTLARARFHQEKAWTAFAGEETRFSDASFLDTVRALIAKGSLGEIETARRELRAAAAEYELLAAAVSRQSSAVKSGENARAKPLSAVSEPKSIPAEFYFQRATFRTFDAVLELAFRQIQREERTPGELRRSLFTPGALEDLNRVAQLNPDDPKAIATALFARALGSVSEEEQAEIWTHLHAEAREQLVSACHMLDNIARSGSKANAAAAIEYLGCAQVHLMKDYPGAERSFRKALDLDPARERSWDFLIFAVYSNGDEARLLETSERRATALPSARSSAILIKCYDRSGDTLRAELAALLAAGSYPHDFAVHLSLAALMLKHEGVEDVLWRAGDALTKAEKQLGAARTGREQLEFTLLKSIYLALSGDPDQAKTLLRPYTVPGRTSPDVQAVIDALN